MFFIGTYVAIVLVMVAAGRLFAPNIFVMSNFGILVRAAFSVVIALVIIGYGLLDPLAAAAAILGMVTAILIGRKLLLRDIDKREREMRK